MASREGKRDDGLYELETFLPARKRVLLDEWHVDDYSFWVSTVFYSRWEGGLTSFYLKNFLGISFLTKSVVGTGYGIVHLLVEN